MEIVVGVIYVPFVIFLYSLGQCNFKFLLPAYNAGLCGMDCIHLRISAIAAGDFQTEPLFSPE